MKANRTSDRGSTPNVRAKVSFEDFEPDRDMNANHRAAQFLDWCAKNMPERFVPDNYIVMHMQMLKRPPKENMDDVVNFRKGKLDAIKRILWNEYDRRVITVPRALTKQGHKPGIRATTGADDLTKNAFIPQTRRIASATRTAQDTRDKIDVKAMHNQDMRALVERTDPVLKQLVRADLMKRLELPAHSDDDD